MGVGTAGTIFGSRSPAAARRGDAEPDDEKRLRWGTLRAGATRPRNRVSSPSAQRLAAMEGIRMEGTRFDLLARSLVEINGRRTALRALLGLGLLGLHRPDPTGAAASGRCTPRCGECERCEKGECRRTRDGEKRCKKGKCKPKPNGSPCGNAGVCRQGRCVCPEGTDLCRGACLPNCGPDTTRNPLTCSCCQVNVEACTPPGFNHPTCCSGHCFFVNNAVNLCRGRDEGAECDFGAQCASGVCGGDGRCTG